MQNELQRFVSTVTLGLIIGVMIVSTIISYGVMIYGEILPDYISKGVCLILIGSSILGILVSCSSSSKGIIARPQDSSAIIMSIMATSLYQTTRQSYSDTEIFGLITLTAVFTTVSVGLIYYGIGFFRRGNFVRKIPFAVVVGFLSGSGYLLVRGGVQSSSGLGLSLANVLLFIESAYLVRWVPALLFSILLLAVLKRYKHFLAMPLFILVSIVVFYSCLSLAGLDIDGAQKMSLLITSGLEGETALQLPQFQNVALGLELFLNEWSNIATLVIYG